MRSTDAVDEARRSMEICNACRYCEGFCAVFPAMERQVSFAEADLGYLANLCHNCRGCYYSCQYAPPHPFGVNLPQTLALVRNQSYRDYAWPAAFARMFDRNFTYVAIGLAFGLALVLSLTAVFVAPGTLGRAWHGPNAFYDVIPWWVMASVGAATFLFSLVAMGVAGRRFWQEAGSARPVDLRAIGRGVHDAFTLKNLGGGGHGCNDLDDRFSTVRRRFHHAVFYGFLACFAATTSAAFEAYFLGVPAPYPVISVPVLFGILGGAGLLVGTSGLIVLKIVADRAPGAETLLGGDFALLVLLWLAGATGLALLAFRATAAMGTLLAIHLGVILTFFLVLPYSKFVHGLYRILALIRNAADGAAG